jgi:DNA invertase Pin-like site-specific DNA recombinase
MNTKTGRKNTTSTFSSNAARTGSVIAYLRVSTDRQDMDGQRLAVLEHARQLGLVVSKVIEVEVSSRKDTSSRRIDELMSDLSNGDTLILSELSRLGRSLTEVVHAINQLVLRKVRVIVVKQGIDIQEGKQDMAGKVMVAIFSLLAELERDLISERTTMALAARRAAGVKLGRPKGSTGKSVLDGRRSAIEELLRHKVSKSAISRMMSVSKSTLHSYLSTRCICAP